MGIAVIGINHRTAPVNVRERLALPGGLAEQLLQAVRSESVLAEALVLDTCNRTEVYYLSKDRSSHLDYLLGHIAQLKGTSETANRSLFYHHRGTDAVSHLFRVAASLDSQIVGEYQILRQLKAAHRLALQAGTSRFVLNRLFRSAFQVGKQVQTQTQLGHGSVGVSLAAVELAEQILTDLADRTVLLVGAGENAELTAQALIRRGVTRLLVANRTIHRARDLADELLKDRSPKAGKAFEEIRPRRESLTTGAVGLADIPSVIAQADLVLCSIDSTAPVLTYQVQAKALAKRDRPLLIIDISVPRCVESRLGRLPNVFLKNIDDLNTMVSRNIEHRQSEIPAAQAIVKHHVQQFGRWLDSLQVAPTIKLLRRHFEQLRQDQIARYGQKFALTEQQELEQFAKSLSGKMLHRPLQFLKKLPVDSSSPEDMAAVDTIRQMFDLDALEQKP